MANVIRLGVGIIGNATSLLMYGAPIITFRRVVKKRSTEDFSGIPYAIALLNCLVYTWYGSPLISDGSDNILVMTVNGTGIVLESCFVCTYLIFAQPKTKENSEDCILSNNEEELEFIPRRPSHAHIN